MSKYSADYIMHAFPLSLPSVVAKHTCVWYFGVHVHTRLCVYVYHLKPIGSVL